MYATLLIALGAGAIWLAEKSAWGRRALQATLLTAVAAGVGFCTYFTIFSRFAVYDDEGYMLTTIWHLLDGKRLYDDVHIPYGPVYYIFAWLVHGVLQVPLGNDSARIGTLILLALSTALATWTVVRMIPAARLGQGITILLPVFWIMHALGTTAEPGHPEVLVLLLVPTALLAGSFVAEAGHGWAMGALGAVAAGLVLIKVNIGGFFCVAALLALVLNAPHRMGWSVVRWVLLAAALLLPAVLMKAHLREAWAQRFCATVVLGVLLCWVVGSRDQRGMRTSLRQLGMFTAGAMALTIVAVGFMLLHGSSLGGMAVSLIVKPARFSTGFGWPIRAPWASLYWSGTGAALAFTYLAARGRLRTVMEAYVLPSCKLVLVVASLAQHWGYRLLAGIDPLRDQVWPLHYAMGFLWLTLLAPGHREPSSRELFMRRLLCFVGALQVLQMYPVPGSQMIVGTAPIILVLMVWVSDSLETLEQAAEACGLSGVFKPVHWGVSFLAIWVIVASTAEAYERFERQVPVHLPGSRLTRMDEGQAALYQCLADSVAAAADTFVCSTGLNSLYVWSNTLPAAPVVIGNSWNLLDESEQTELLTLNRLKPRLIFIEHPGWFGPNKMTPFLEYVHEAFRPVARLDGYTIMARAERTDVRLRSCAWRVTDEAARRLVLQAAAMNDPRTVRMQVLRLSIPRAYLGRQVTHVRLIDLLSRGMLADTAARDPETRAILLDRAGQKLLPMNIDTAAVPMPASPEAWDLAIPASIDLGKTTALSFPALQFYDKGTHIMTIPVAVGWAEPTAEP
ncbi:MAG: hypothetical protein ACHQ9S_02675 [Candidatus Binatia bacterium]